MIPYVLVCGRPGTGNNLIANFLQHHGVYARIWHPQCREIQPTQLQLPPNNAKWTHAIRCTRDEGIRHKSRARKQGVDYAAKETRRCNLGDALFHSWLHQHEIRPLYFYYQQLVRDPEAIRQEILLYVGMKTDLPWQAEIYDGDAKYHEPSPQLQP